jgi:tripartite-type tricarboxylate transporter receptor subunit TctC
MRTILTGVLMAMLSGYAAQAQAQDLAADFPNRPIKMVVSVPPGGGVDTVTRFVAENLQKKLGQPVIVENRAGAAGNIAAEYVYVADPDGYTLLAAQPAPLTVNPLLYKNINFDPTKFEPVVIMTSIANVLMVRTDFPAKTAQEFIAYAKANPGKINYASQGTGTTSHLTAALFDKDAGITTVHVPFKGTAPALNALIGGHVDMIFMEFASAIKQHESGYARILAVATTKRVPSLPDVPTFDEIGVKGFESGTWNAVVAPPKTPAAIVAKLNKAMNEVLNSPEGAAHFAKLSLSAAGGTPAQASAFIASETKVWSDVIRDAHVVAN